MQFDQVREIIAAESGRQFDPDVAAAFLAGFYAFTAIAERHRDNG
jgi:putative two-component system response regulator